MSESAMLEQAHRQRMGDTVDRRPVSEGELARPSSQPLVSPCICHNFGAIAVNRIDRNEADPIAADTPDAGAPKCANPGNARSVSLQPVFFRSSDKDASPTGGSWSRRCKESNTIWGKVGVTFTELAPVTLTDATNKTAGTDAAEYHTIRKTREGAGIEVFMVDNDMASFGGGGTVRSGTADAQIVLSDRGTSDTLLAHELGHVLGVGHPGDAHGGDANTIMVGSNSHSAANSTRNTMGNFKQIQWPAAGAATCLNPDA